MNWMIYLWVGLIVLFVIAEAVTVQLVTIWFAVGAVGGFIANLCGASDRLQWVVFLAVSIVALILSRPLAKKYLNSRFVPTNADRSIGKTAVVTREINNPQNVGEARVDGAVWSARSKDGNIIPEGTEVTVCAIEGVKIIVK